VALESSFFSAYCLDCVETACCPAAAACNADPACVTCLDDTSSAGCDQNAAILDLLACVVSSTCPDACGCLNCGCIDDGICGAGFMGFEVCSCPDCMVDLIPACQGVCPEQDGTCDGEDPCTCADCAEECTACNLDGFCDTYGEGCPCADCTGHPACAGRP
jgi:hypothetical protein